MPCFYLIPKQDDFDKIPELQVCIAEALYDAEAVLSNPSAFKAEEIRTCGIRLSPTSSGRGGLRAEVRMS